MPSSSNLAFLQKQSIDTERALLSEAHEATALQRRKHSKLELVEQQILPREQDPADRGASGAGKPSPSGCSTPFPGICPSGFGSWKRQYKTQALDIKGRALSNIQISEYSKALQKSGLFNDVTISSSNQISVGKNVFQEFILRAPLPAPPAKGPVAK